MTRDLFCAGDKIHHKAHLNIDSSSLKHFSCSHVPLTTYVRASEFISFKSVEKLQ